MLASGWMLPQSLRRRRLILEFRLMLENTPTFACIDKQLMTRYLEVITGSTAFSCMTHIDKYIHDFRPTCPNSMFAEL